MIKIIKNKEEHESAMNRIAELMASDPASGSVVGDELELLAHLVEDYEKKHHDIGLPTPLEAIQFRMEQQHLRQSWRHSRRQSSQGKEQLPNS